MACAVRAAIAAARHQCIQRAVDWSPTDRQPREMALREPEHTASTTDGYSVAVERPGSGALSQAGGNGGAGGFFAEAGGAGGAANVGDVAGAGGNGGPGALIGGVVGACRVGGLGANNFLATAGAGGNSGAGGLFGTGGPVAAAVIPDREAASVLAAWTARRRPADRRRRQRRQPGQRPDCWGTRAPPSRRG